MVSTANVHEERFFAAMDRWTAGITPDQTRDALYRDAIESVDQALAATIKHVRESSQGSGRSTTKSSDEISALWRGASNKVGVLDSELADALGMKGLGWIDKDAWVRARARGLRISIPEMEVALGKLRAARGRRSDAVVPKWFPIAGLGFAAITVLFLMYMIVLGPSLDGQRRIIFDVLVALCVAASGAFLGGTAVADGKLPFFKNAPLRFSAAGGIAIFIIVFLLMRHGAGAVASDEAVRPVAPPATATVRYKVCIGQYASACGPHDVHLTCGNDLNQWATSTCTKFASTILVNKGGNRCGYLVAEVTCTKKVP